MKLGSALTDTFPFQDPRCAAFTDALLAQLSQTGEAGGHSHAAQPLVQTFLRHGLSGLGVRVIRPRQSHWGAAVSASPATALRLVIDGCAIGQLLCDWGLG
jgi:hypothetical protein